MAEIIAFPRRATIITQLQAAANELRLVVEQEEETQVASEIWSVIETLETIIERL
jgi:hypothetical protein